MTGWFVLSKNENFLYQFVLKAANGEEILTSKTYQSKISAQDGIASVQLNSVFDKCYEKKLSHKNQPYFVLKSTNGEFIGISEMYFSNVELDSGISSVKQNGSTSAIVDNTGVHDFANTSSLIPRAACA